MPVKISGDLGLNSLIKKFEGLNGLSVEVYVDGGEKQQMIATVNEFGAKIYSKAAIRWLAIQMARYAKSIGILASSGKYKMGGGGGGVGYITIPERSFFRSAFDDPEVQSKILETVNFYLYRYLSGKNTEQEVVTRAAGVLVNAIQSKIESEILPENHPLTVRLKHHDRTLRGKTGELIKSIRYRIVK